MSSLMKFAKTNRQKEILALKEELGSNCKVAEHLGIDRRGVDRQIKAVEKRALKAGAILQPAEGLKVLLIDIETAPMEGYIWRMFSDFTNIGAIKDDWYIMSYSYKWLGTPVDDIFAKTQYQCKGYEAGSENDRELVADLWQLLDEADVIIGHNGDNFDLKKIKARMIKYGFNPPTPYKTIDTLKICRREFGFTSNKLEYVGQYLFSDGKLPTGGLNLWINCKQGDPVAWATMGQYNAMDVELLERVYMSIRPWDRGTANLSLLEYQGDDLSCNACGSNNVSLTGKLVNTPVSQFHGYVCNDCGHQMRGKKNVMSKVEKENVLHNAI